MAHFGGNSASGFVQLRLAGNKNPGNFSCPPISACLGILENYDDDKRFPVYGFGGKLPERSKVSHNFALNGDIFNPHVNGVQGVILCYQNALNQGRLYDPTHFSEILREVNNHVTSDLQARSQQKFHILIIITDGVINDMNKTID